MASPDDDSEVQALIDELNSSMSTSGEYTPSANYWRRRFRILKHERFEVIEDSKQQLAQAHTDLVRIRTELDYALGDLAQARQEAEHIRQERDWHSEASAKLWVDVQREHESAVKWWTEYDTASKRVLELQDALACAKAEAERWQSRAITAEFEVLEIRASRLIRFAHFLRRIHRASRRILRKSFKPFHLLSR